MGMRPVFSVDGVSVILGNNLALGGGQVWSERPSPLIVSSKPVSTGDVDESVQSLPDVFSACVVTHATSGSCSHTGT